MIMGNESTVYTGGFNTGFFGKTRADEVEKLIEVAESCGITKDNELFGKIFDRIYPSFNNFA